MGEMKEAFSPFPGAEKTGVFMILGAVRPPPNICEFDMVREPFCFKIFLQDFGSTRIKTEVNVNWEELVMNGDSPASFVEEVKERQAIFPSGDPYQKPVPLLD
jgi:hypothetical protein